LPYLYGSLIIIGLLLIDWAGYDSLLPDPAPYRYELVAEGNAVSFLDLSFPAPPETHVKKFETRLDQDGKVLAEVFLVYLGSEVAPILLNWRNLRSEAVLGIPTRTEDLEKLALAVDEHVEEGAVILGWWDTARQLSVLDGVNSLYDRNFSRPLFLPPAWKEDKDAIESLERIFWRIIDEGEGDFGRVVDALASPPEAGISIFHELAEGNTAFLVVQVSDLYKLALLRPGVINVGYQDFQTSGDIHDSILTVKGWLEERQLSHYIVEKMGVTAKRVYYLNDGQGVELPLLARLLPLGEFDPFSMEGLKLVGNYGSYWVYEVVFGAGKQTSGETQGVNGRD
jgi:hydroxylamine oxidation protein HaoB